MEAVSQSASKLGDVATDLSRHVVHGLAPKVKRANPPLPPLHTRTHTAAPPAAALGLPTVSCSWVGGRGFFFDWYHPAWNLTRVRGSRPGQALAVVTEPIHGAIDGGISGFGKGALRGMSGLLKSSIVATGKRAAERAGIRGAVRVPQKSPEFYHNARYPAVPHGA